MHRCSLVGAVFLFAACSFNPSGGVAIDAADDIDARTDASEDDAGIDAPDVDAPDGSVDANDAAMIDAPDIDAAVDAAVDAPTDAAVDAAVDAPPPIDIAYLPTAAETAGTGDATINGNTTINTTVGQTPPNLGTGVTFTTATPTGGGADILVMHVDDLTIGASGTLRVIGTRPFAIVAGGNVNIAGAIDLSAVGTTAAGAGGSASSTGSGAGTDGTHEGDRTDTGAGGAGYGTAGARGGTAICTLGLGCIGNTHTVNGGAGGPVYNMSLAQLVGGSGGGNAADIAGCAAFDGGAGGGAILIYAAGSIAVSGVIEAHGGGGGRGRRCGNDSTAGAGGGSGGQIDLQSPSITITGFVGANGGGGGGGAEGANADGMAGQDGRNDGMAAGGGAGTGASGGDGGAGGFASTAPVQGEDMSDDDNSGGGGGAVGRVTIRFRGTQPTVTTSPPPAFVSY
ncbi:MAG TPA: hypothetical protein VM261_25000 [Kofleriaceae bacterium]|nr:hypothetical protein [Kofleriaceae bacterium]